MSLSGFRSVRPSRRSSRSSPPHRRRLPVGGARCVGRHAGTRAPRRRAGAQGRRRPISNRRCRSRATSCRRRASRSWRSCRARCRASRWTSATASASGRLSPTLDRREIDAQVDAAAAAVNVARAGAGVGRSGARQRRARARPRAEPVREGRHAAAAARRRRHGARARRPPSATWRRPTLAQAEAALRRAREVQRDATLTSPIDGVVVERNYDAGSLVGPGDNKPVVVVADLRVMKLEAGVSELEAGRLRVGMPARVSVQARPGEIVRGTARGDRAGGGRAQPSLRDRGAHAEPAARCSRGCTRVATIPLERVDGVVAVPRDAITTRGGRRVALKIEHDTVAGGAGDRRARRAARSCRSRAA